MSKAMVLRIVVSRRCILGMHTPVSGGYGFETVLWRDGGADTHGAQYRAPRVMRTGSINPLLTGSPHTNPH